MSVRVLKIPAEVVDALRVPPDEIEDELKKKLALALYQRGILSSGKARILSGMIRSEFEELLGKRTIHRHYTEIDLGEDIAYARGDR